MNTQLKCIVLLVCLATLAGCAGKDTRYAWCDYDCKLYEHYKDPAQKEEFILGLKETIADAEAEGKVPPGIYAEYGYVMYEKGDVEQAVLYYKKESEKWPESRFLMSKMIENTKKKTAKKEPEVKPDVVPAPDNGSSASAGGSSGDSTAAPTSVPAAVPTPTPVSGAGSGAKPNQNDMAGRVEVLR